MVLPLLAPPASRADPEPTARVACTITDERITEASGLAVNGDVRYVINDGGDSIQVFELGPDCRVRQVLEDPTDPYDVEDLARTPDGRLWLSDTGDNREERETVALEVLAPSGRLSLYRMSYPDGPHDAEALLVDHSGRPYVITKSPLGSSGVYTPQDALATGRTTALRKVTTLRFFPTGTPGGPVRAVSPLLVTGAALAPDGRRLAVRTYTDVYLWDVPDGDIAAALGDGKPKRLALPREEQGEAVAFSSDGRSLLTVSEGTPTALHVLPLPADVLAGPSPTADPARTRNQADHQDSKKEQDTPTNGKKGGSRPLVVNLALSALIATVIVGGLGRLRRRK